MEYLVVLAVVAVALYLITGPLRAVRAGRPAGAGPTETVAELEAARDAKYLEIRDAELDLRTGKLSPEDHQALDGALRAEAVAILHRLDVAAAERAPDEPEASGDEHANGDGRAPGDEHANGDGRAPGDRVPSTP